MLRIKLVSLGGLTKISREKKLLSRYFSHKARDTVGVANYYLFFMVKTFINLKMAGGGVNMWVLMEISAKNFWFPLPFHTVCSRENEHVSDQAPPAVQLINKLDT